MRQFDQNAVQAFLRDVATGGEPRRELTAPDGSRLVFERDPSPGISESLTEVGPGGAAHVHGRLFAASATPPPGYPAAAPFIPGRAVHVGDPGGDGNFMLTWDGLDDPGSLVSELVRASTAEGWNEPVPAGGALGRAAMGALSTIVRASTGTSLQFRRLARGNRQRIITAGGRNGGGGYVTFGEVPERANPAASAPGAA